LGYRRPQAQQSNVIGIGKWAHTSTGVAPPVASTSTPTPAPANQSINQTTEYTPASRPAQAQNQTPSSVSALTNPPIPPSGDIGTPLNLQPPNPQPNPNSNGIHDIKPYHHPQSDLPVVTIPGGNGKIDPGVPTGIIPSTGLSVWEIDAGVFEGSGQPWRRVGSDLSDWFNFGFDEVTFGRYLRMRTEMEVGRAALVSVFWLVLGFYDEWEGDAYEDCVRRIYQWV
jgi:pre-mRNA 3'-end-processing factor FIP1